MECLSGLRQYPGLLEHRRSLKHTNTAHSRNVRDERVKIRREIASNRTKLQFELGSGGEGE